MFTISPTLRVFAIVNFVAAMLLAILMLPSAPGASYGSYPPIITYMPSAMTVVGAAVFGMLLVGFAQLLDDVRAMREQA